MHKCDNSGSFSLSVAIGNGEHVYVAQDGLASAIRISGISKKLKYNNVEAATGSDNGIFEAISTLGGAIDSTTGNS